jgi:hypothetical protein
LLLADFIVAQTSDTGIRWRHLSSRNGDLPVTGESHEQTENCRYR